MGMTSDRKRMQFFVGKPEAGRHWWWPHLRIILKLILE